MNANDKKRRNDKAAVVTEKLQAIVGAGQTFMLMASLDEWKLDLLLLALGDGEVVVREN